MPRVATTLVLLLAMPTATFAKNPGARHATEIRSDHRLHAIDRSWMRRDAHELAAFEQLITELQDACEDRMTGRYRDVNTNVQAAMMREIEQAAVKSAQAVHEARLEGRDLRGEQMDAGVTGDSADFLDAYDDVYDTDNAFVRHESMQRLGTMAGALQNDIERGERNAMERNIALVNEFISLMRRDVAAGRQNRAEERVGRR